MNIEQEKMIVESLSSIYPMQKFEEDAIKVVLDALPSAETKRVKGRWITDKQGYVTWSAICNKCGARTQMFDGYYNFCPHCGVKMEK